MCNLSKRKSYIFFACAVLCILIVLLVFMTSNTCSVVANAESVYGQSVTPADMFNMLGYTYLMYPLDYLAGAEVGGGNLGDQYFLTSMRVAVVNNILHFYYLSSSRPHLLSELAVLDTSPVRVSDFAVVSAIDDDFRPMPDFLLQMVDGVPTSNGDNPWYIQSVNYRLVYESLPGYSAVPLYAIKIGINLATIAYDNVPAVTGSTSLILWFGAEAGFGYDTFVTPYGTLATSSVLTQVSSFTVSLPTLYAGFVDYLYLFSQPLYDNGFSSGSAYVVNNPGSFDLYTKQQYLQYGQQRYDTGKNVGFAEGSQNPAMSLSALLGSISSQLDIPLLGDISLGDLIAVGVSLMLFMWFLKMFAGG